ncbi:NTP transferase domain-containing protein [Candidatus Sumerlaeota bacterium]|nr:NTP transferase domain-containing protein [Candidatus Sumerlaeota bacterium]
MRVRTAVITAAGFGNRLQPATAVIPKVMLPLIDTPAIQMVVVEALEAGVERVVLVVGHGADLVRRHFEKVVGPWRGVIEWVVQPRMRGLADAIHCARSAVGEEPFAVLFGDCVFLEGNPTRTLMEDFEVHGHSALIAERVKRGDISKRGIFETEGTQGDRLLVRSVVEKPSPDEAPSDLAVAGRCLFTPGVFPALAEVTPDASGERHLAPAINRLLESEPVAVRLIPERRLDIGNPEDYVAAIQAVAAHRGLLQE